MCLTQPPPSRAPRPQPPPPPQPHPAQAQARRELGLFPATPLGLEGDDAAAVLGGHLSLMEQFILSGAEVMQSFVTPPAPARQRTFPLLGNVVSIEPGEALVAERVIDLDSDFYLRDHTIGRGVSRTDPGLTALAVMPMTMSLEILAEAAAALMPELVVTGMHEVRAHRWLVVGESPAMVEITAVRLDSTARRDDGRARPAR